jgi:isoleucyl-tRNA synthetase
MSGSAGREDHRPRRGEPYFPNVPAAIDLPVMEQEILRRWQDSKVFERSLEQTATGPLWTFYEGPPTANGMPGVHHVEARVFKDVFPRFKTMQGFHVPRQAGWDCHGLPVEVAVERELGLNGKKDIEAYGIAAFNQRCRESVLLHVDAFEELTTRLGYWVDMAGAYRTMDSSYVESVWWSLKQVFDSGLLVRDYRITPYCPRCQTPLSDHEMGQPDVYETVTDPSVTVRFPLVSLPSGADPRLLGADLLVWTTTPWTLVSNTAVAVHPDETYVLARRSGDSELVVVAEKLFGRVLGEGWHVLTSMPGSALAGARYRPPFSLIDVPDAHLVLTAPFVTTDDGTGLVHMSPAFGADDMEAAREYGLPVVNPIGLDGRFEASVPLVGGMFFKDADPVLTHDLAERDLLFRSGLSDHSYPHCWRCHSVLLYYALPSWYIRTTQIKDQLLAENERTNWQPPGIKHGRYGEWLRNNVDWALSRTRYWGTPLPLWECGEGHPTCVGSLAELSELAGRDLSGLDPHRPYVDEVEISCRECGEPARRVPEVIDAWYDSGSMPFARLGAPYRNSEQFEQAYPAQFICEAIDQTRGWFYSLMAVGTLVFGRSSYENVVCLGLVVDERGRKMSKHLGNVLEPLPLLNEHGADAVRWFFAASGSPWSTRRVGHAPLDEIVRKVLLTYWNTVSFLALYANAASAQGQAWAPEEVAGAPAPADRPLLDRWVLGELAAVVSDVTAAMEAFDTAAAGRRLAAFIDDLSNWYVRRSRRRFWNGPGNPDGAAAFATLYQCLETLTRLMAPVAPFLTEHVWQILRAPGAPDSVHLASWPQPEPVQPEPVQPEPALAGDRLPERMRLVRRLVELGRSARASAGVGVRQPLPRALVSAAQFADLPAELREQIESELNVRSLDALSAVGEDLTDYAVKPNFRALGRRFGKGTPPVAAAVAAADPGALAGQLRTSGAATVTVEGGTVSLGPDELIVTQTPRAGWAVASEAGETVALDLQVTQELRREGLAREVIRLVQDARKADGLAVTDRITFWWRSGNPDVARAVAEHGQLIAGEVLATGFEAVPHDAPAPAPGGGAAVAEHYDETLDLTFWLRRA